MQTAEKHQLNIARQTLRMTPAAARIMGGMDYATAYALVFKTPLRARLDSLIADYGDSAGKSYEDGGVCWELSKYGYTPAELKGLL